MSIPPTFAVLWENHPHVKGEAPLLDTKIYDNQCAINLSAAFLRSGVDMSSRVGCAPRTLNLNVRQNRLPTLLSQTAQFAVLNRI